MHASASIVIARPPKAVFEFMDVPENQARISPRLSAVETVGTLDSGGKLATYTYRLAGLSFDGAVRGIEHDPPEAITFEMVGDIAGEIRWRFEPADGGTRVTYTATYDLGLPPVAGPLLSPVLDWFNQRELEQTLENLRQSVSTPEYRRPTGQS
ncbi:SRPBCC family protein [Haloarcula sediminis]|uniref:SRPBCC family protein n=1 Tax=Haloarcula sediminis TaxID=3111777 RepID=UPI002D76DABA|nr:SRPBCC family protein [Haloarcula sp. CK38]